MKFGVRQVYLLITLTLATTAMAEPVWVSFGSSQYALSEVGGTWTECEAEAISLGAHLVSVNNEEENAWLVDQFGETPLWIGLRETDNDGIYVWASGDTLGFEAWAPGQPDWLHWDHDYVSINLMGSIGLWHNSHDNGYPGGTPSTGIMERTGTTSVSGFTPQMASLWQNSPNPFNPMTEICFELPTLAFARLVVYDIAGRQISILAEGDFQPDTRYHVQWDGRDETGKQVSSGTYFYRLEAGNYLETKRMALVR